MRDHRHVTFALLLSTFALMATLEISSAQETPAGMIRAVPDRPTRVFIMAAFDDNCRSLPAPAITITAAPQKGAVQFREGQSTTVQFSATGKCVGKPVTGTGIYYAAKADASGEDTFTISAKSSTGEIATRTFRMFISDGI